MFISTCSTSSRSWGLSNVQIRDEHYLGWYLRHARCAALFCIFLLSCLSVVRANWRSSSSVKILFGGLVAVAAAGSDGPDELVLQAPSNVVGTGRVSLPAV